MSCAVTASEPASDIAGVGTVFPVAVTIGGEVLAARRTNIFVHGLKVQPVRVCLIPANAAIDATEFPFLHFGTLYNWRTAVQAPIRRHFRKGVGCRYFTGQAVVPAVSLDAILGQTDGVGDGRIAVALMPEVCDLHPLFVCHGDLQSEGLAFTFHWRLEADLSGQK